MTMQKYEKPNPFQVLKIPTENIRMIFALLPLVQDDKNEQKKVETMSILALTCQFFYNLTQKNHVNFALVARHALGKSVNEFTLFKGSKLILADIEEHYFVPKLIESSVSADQEQMQRLLTLHPALAAKKHEFTDWSGRTFNCSVFEYALWTKDIKYMCPMILGCLPKNAAGETIRMELQKQAQDMLANGLSYQLEGKSYQETFFSLDPLKQALKTYVDNFGNWDRAERNKHWCTVVGREQLFLPAYIRQHYCEESFRGQAYSPMPNTIAYRAPSFSQEQFIRSLQFNNSACLGYSLQAIMEAIKNGKPLWNSSVSGLGEQFAIVGGGNAGPAHTFMGTDLMAADLASITMLDKVRIESDLPLLLQRLENPLQELDDTADSRCSIP